MSDDSHSAMLDFVERYGKKPALFVQEVLGVEPLPYQAEFLEAIASGERKISIGSGHGTGTVSYTHLTLPTKRIV